MVSIGIDPGLKGAIAVIVDESNEAVIANFPKWLKWQKVTTDEGKNVSISFCPYSPMPERYCDIIASAQYAKEALSIPTSFCVEKVWAFPHEGVSQSFCFGETFGFIKGALAAYGELCATDFAVPVRWQKEYGVSGQKQEHIAKAKELFNGIDLRRNERCRNDFDGFADALLIAEYGKRKAQ